MPTFATSKSTWAKDTELVGIQLELQPLKTCMLYQRYMVGLHAWFLEQVNHLDSELSTYLHDGGDEKPFTLSNLKGLPPLVENQFQIQAEQTYQWSIYALSKPVAQWLATWVRQVPNLLEVRDATFQIKRVDISQPPTTYKKLMRSQPSASKIIQLDFLSPTSFRIQGYSFPFPLPHLVFQSYLRRWNDFSNNTYDVESYLDWIEENIHVYDYQLVAQKVAVAKQGFCTGFTGSLTYEIARAAHQSPEALRLLHALLNFAPYGGTGCKTAFGLGRSVVELLSSPRISLPPIPQPPDSLPIEHPQPLPTPQEPALSIQDIDVLTQQFLARRKRQGGTRGIMAARMEAEIIIRHQAGESLSAIALKMGKSYDAVKKAFARAKQASLD
jgi:CRISPR-associated endoribonuclease Cas6